MTSRLIVIVEFLQRHFGNGVIPEREAPTLAMAHYEGRRAGPIARVLEGAV